ncbi:hypothetical protein ABPG74_004824 [Tetrahymena malaccensis]
MESQSESNNKLIQDKQSIFFQNSQIEEAKSSQFNETLVDRSRQRYLFEQQNNKLQQSHRGDSEIQESSMQDGIITTFEMKQLISTERRSLQTNCWDEINSKMCKDNQSINEQVIQVQIENDSCSQQEMKQDFSKIESMIINDQQEQQQPQNLEQNNTQNINLQDKSIIAASQNAPIKESQIYQPINQINEEKLCIKNENEKEIWFQEDIFYEKNLKKLGTKVTFQLKGQYQIQQDNNRLSKYKQNFLKATNIINRLLNNSVSRVVKIRQHVQNFVNILKLRHFNRKLDELNENDFISINDLSHFYFPNDKKKQNYQNSSLIYNIERLSKLLPVFMPTDLARVIWDMIQVLYTYLFLYIYSIFIFFDQHDFKSQLMQKLCLYSFINYLADIIINLNTAIFNKDNIIDRRKLIAKQYFLSTIFVTDFLSMTVLISKLFNFRELTLQNQNYNFFKCVFNILIFLKVNGISEKKKRFDYIITLTENQKHVIKLINQIASVMTVAHIAAIGWYFLGIQEIQSNQNNWLDKLDISDHQYYEKYIYSIYWAITTMTTGFILQEIEKSSKQLNDDITIIQSKLLKQNQEICNFLKHNLKEQNYEYYDMFETNEHLFTSEDTQSKFQNDEDDEDSISQITYNFDEQSMDVNSQAINRAQKRKKANVFMKGMKKTNNFSTQNIEDNESILSQEKHSQNTKSNSYQENQDYIKAASNFSGFQIKTMSFEAQDNLNIKQDHQKKENFFSQQCKALHKLETDPNNQSITEISNQQSSLEEEEISIINGSKKSGSQKQIQSSFNIINQHQYDIDKKQFKKLSSNNHLNIQYSKQISHQSIDDQNLNKNKNGQLIKQDTIDNLNKQQCFHKPISPDQNQNKQLNQKEVKHLIDQILLQNIILNNFLHDNKLPQLQQLNILNNACSIQDLIDKNPIQNTFDKRIKSIKEENFVKHTSSVRSNRDIKEKRSSLISQHSNYFNNQNRRDDKSNLSSNNYEILQNCIKNKDTCQANKINLISGVSNVLENAQIPLNLQINNNQSYLQSESEDLPITIESFDKIQFFKKYFPHNNFEKVMQKLKQYQSEQKKIKKNKLASKQRRQNIGFSNNVILSMFQGNSNLIKFIPQDYNINLYKPTYLSYGVKMQKGNKFPKNFYTQEKNNS